jgi:hypothetical protein
MRGHYLRAPTVWFPEQRTFNKLAPMSASDPKRTLKLVRTVARRLRGNNITDEWQSPPRYAIRPLTKFARALGVLLF